MFQAPSATIRGWPFLNCKQAPIPKATEFEKKNYKWFKIEYKEYPFFRLLIVKTLDLDKGFFIFEKLEALILTTNKCYLLDVYRFLTDFPKNNSTLYSSRVELRGRLFSCHIYSSRQIRNVWILSQNLFPRYIEF